MAFAVASAAALYGVGSVIASGATPVLAGVTALSLAQILVLHAAALGILASVLRGERERPAAEILSALLGALTGQVGSGPVYDDWTLIVVKRL